MVLTIDIGGTHIKYGAVDEKTEAFEAMGHVDTNIEEEGFSIMNRIYSLIDSVRSQQALSGVAISTAGIVDPLKGKIVFANDNIPSYTNTCVKDLIEKRYSIACAVENDVNCALLGELFSGGYEGVQNAVMITVGTGIGGALFLNGAIFHGSAFSAGEVGYSILGPDTAENMASTTALISRVKARTGLTEIDGQWIFEQAKKENVVCVTEIDAMVHSLGALIMNSVSLVNPEVVFLGGGIMEQREYLAPRVKKAFSGYLNSYVRERTTIHFASLGNNAGMLGAYRHYKNSLKYLV